MTVKVCKVDCSCELQGDTVSIYCSVLAFNRALMPHLFLMA